MPQSSALRLPESSPTLASDPAEDYAPLLLIGRGGMGTVEIALQRMADGLERIVALKRLLPEAARDRRHHEMFLREARLATLVTHPNVVRAFAYGDRGGELFLAMEYVEGETLDNLLEVARERGTPLDPGMSAYVLAEICEGLHAAHELRDSDNERLNVVHRDVSPHNVMISYDGAVKLLDFGVAKFDAPGLTRTGEVKGKMAYMSPEQALGEPLDRRTDLFSIGAVLYECLTGKRMWGTGTDVEIMRRLALESPPELAAGPNVPKTLADLQTALVARNPEKRPQTALAVANELRAVCESICDVDKAKLRTLMQELFSEQASARRRELRSALEQAAPHAETIRSSLDTIVPPEPKRNDEKNSGRVIPIVAAALLLVSLVTAAWTFLPGLLPHPKLSPTTSESKLPGAQLQDDQGARPSEIVGRVSEPSKPGMPNPATTETVSIRPATNAHNDGTTVAPKTNSHPKQAPAASASKRPPDVDPTPF